MKVNKELYLYFKAKRLQGQLMVEKASNRKADKKIKELKEKLFKIIKKVGKEAISLFKNDNGIATYNPDIFDQSLSIVMERYREEFAEIMTEYNVEAAQLGKNKTVNHMQVLGFSLQHEAINDRVLELIKEQTFEASEETLANIKGDVMENLTESYRQGLGIDDAAKHLNDVFDNMEDHQLERIARTEINGNLQKGAHETMNDLNVEYTQWISADDSRTRDSHVELDGQITKRNDKYSNGLEAPGDRSGPIEEWINCRCREVPFIMPRGYTAPAGVQWFYEKDLEKITA